MTAQRLHLPAALILCALTLSAWLHVLNGTRSGLSVVNHSGSVLRNVEVCLTPGQCVVRERLWPHEAWQLPARDAAGQPGQVVQVTYTGTDTVRKPEWTQAQVVLRQDGRIRLAQ